MSKDSRYSKTTSYVDYQGNVVSYTDNDPYREVGEHMDTGLAFAGAFPTLSKILGVATTIVVFLVTYNMNFGWMGAGICALIAGGLAWAFGVYILFLAIFCGVIYLIYLFAVNTGGFGK